MGVFKGPTSQFVALLKKKWSFQKRQHRSNLCQLMAPFVMIGFLWSMQHFYDGLRITVNADLPLLTHEPVVNNFNPPDFPGLSLVQTLTYLAAHNPPGKDIGTLPNLAILPGTQLLGEIDHGTYGTSTQWHSPYVEKLSNSNEMEDHIRKKLTALKQFVTKYDFDAAAMEAALEQMQPTEILDLVVPLAGYSFRKADNPFNSPGPPSHFYMDYDVVVPEMSLGLYEYTGPSESGPGNRTVYHLPVGQGLMTNLTMAMSAMNNAWLRSFRSSYHLTTVHEGFPYRDETPDMDLVGFAGMMFFTFCFMFMFPMQVTHLVHEKQDKLREMMKMMGLQMVNYWAADFVFSYMMYLVVSVFIYGMCYLLGFRMFVYGNVGIIFTLILLWGLTQISMSWLIACFFNRQRIAAVVCYLLLILSVMVAQTYNNIVFQFFPATVGYMLYPPFALARGWYLISIHCAIYQCITPDQIVSSQMASVYAYLVVDFFICLILFYYFDSVIPSEFGVRKPYLFFLQPLFECGPWNRKRRRADSTKKRNIFTRCFDGLYKMSLGAHVREDAAEPLLGGEDKEDFSIPDEGEDPDVTEERERVRQCIADNITVPVLLNGLHKKYPPVFGRPTKVALKSLSLAIEEGECFGLLGPNGAGKSTTISVLTGLYPATRGDGFIDGFEVSQNLAQAQRRLGVCPQFDILWDELTVEEHILFYMRIKGTPKEEEMSQLDAILRDVAMEDIRYRQAGGLDGGYKRALSVAISMAGGANIIFLDEPTTGLDPESRRKLWNVVSAIKKGRCVILTTHSMTEADALCSRIGIMALGTLRCLGTPMYLKAKFGKGYHFQINYHPSDAQRAQAYVSKLLPSAELAEEFSGVATYQLPAKDIQISSIFAEMEANKAKNGVSDWAVSQSSLTDVFLNIVGQDELG